MEFMLDESVLFHHTKGAKRKDLLSLLLRRSQMGQRKEVRL